MRKSEVLTKLEDMLTKQRQDLNNGSDYQDAEAILVFLEEQGVKTEKDPVLFRTKFVWDKE